MPSQVFLLSASKHVPVLWFVSHIRRSTRHVYRAQTVRNTYFSLKSMIFGHIFFFRKGLFNFSYHHETRPTGMVMNHQLNNEKIANLYAAYENLSKINGTNFSPEISARLALLYNSSRFYSSCEVRNKKKHPSRFCWILTILNFYIKGWKTIQSSASARNRQTPHGQRHRKHANSARVQTEENSRW